MVLGRKVTLVYGFSDQGQDVLIKEALTGVAGCRYYRHPEAHRHPTEVVEWLNQLVLGLDGQVVIESHSEVVVAYFRMAMALGVMSLEEVKVYWVSRESGAPVATDLGLTAGGGFHHSWPSGYFPETMRIVNADSFPVNVRSKT